MKNEKGKRKKEKGQIGRASCRERVQISVGAVSLKKKKEEKKKKKKKKEKEIIEQKVKQKTLATSQYENR